MKILLAVDGSPGSEAAVEEVCRRPWPAKTQVRIALVESPVDGSLLGTSEPSIYDEIVKQQRSEAVSKLSRIVQGIERCSPHLKALPILLEGNPTDAILGEAERWGADLIVLGSQGGGPLRRFFLGSVSQAVATNAPCSVEIVRSSFRPQSS